jgi:hypothetical protein
MHEPTAMQRLPVMQSLFQRVEHEARVRLRQRQRGPRIDRPLSRLLQACI